MPHDDHSPSDKGWHSAAHSPVTRETEQNPNNRPAESEQHHEQKAEQEPEWKGE